MKSFSSSMVIRTLRQKGWYEVACVGDHHQFKHPSISGRITIPHPKKNLPIGTVRAIFKQAGINEY